MRRGEGIADRPHRKSTGILLLGRPADDSPSFRRSDGHTQRLKQLPHARVLVAPGSSCIRLGKAPQDTEAIPDPTPRRFCHQRDENDSLLSAIMLCVQMGPLAQLISRCGCTRLPAEDGADDGWRTAGHARSHCRGSCQQMARHHLTFDVRMNFRS